MTHLNNMFSKIFLFISLASAAQTAQAFSSTEHEIVGGDAVTDLASFEYKHTVRLLVRGTLDGANVPDRLKGFKMSWRCSGALVSKRVVISAAHCFPRSIGINDPDTDAQIRAEMVNVSAEVFFKTDTRSDRPWGTKSEKIVVHDGFRDDWFGKVDNVWNPSESVHDIALVKLVEDAPSEKAPVAILEEKEAQMQPGEELVLAGYGRDITDDQISIPRLKRVAVPWREALRNGTEWYLGQGDLVRAGKVDRPAGGCVGDSGGPVYAKRGSAIRLAGLIVRGPDEANGGCRAAVTIATSVPAHRTWLTEKLKELTLP